MFTDNDIEVKGIGVITSQNFELLEMHAFVGVAVIRSDTKQSKHIIHYLAKEYLVNKIN